MLSDTFSEDVLEIKFDKSNRLHFITYIYVDYITNYVNWRYIESPISVRLFYGDCSYGKSGTLSDSFA